MKASVGYFLFVCVLIFFAGCSSSKLGILDSKADKIIGLWEVKAIHNSDESGYKVIPSGMFKMIFPDGRFMNFMSTEKGAIITVDGTYRLEGDIYTEEIVNSFNKSQEGKDNPLNIKLTHENFMYLRWFQPIDEFGVKRNRWIEEIWQRVCIEDLEVSNVDLRQELKQLLINEEVIEKVVE
ncbi:MAG: DUF4488 domain-containing protein [Proteiniphilum sp.]|nr:DUF4488 domain-containing protein [Proteiniphilum sp.]MDD3909692.1 DUF4488 domain-containing protein [Proteiniphilum sp.]